MEPREIRFPGMHLFSFITTDFPWKSLLRAWDFTFREGKLAFEQRPEQRLGKTEIEPCWFWTPFTFTLQDGNRFVFPRASAMLFQTQNQTQNSKTVPNFHTKSRFRKQSEKALDLIKIAFSGSQRKGKSVVSDFLRSDGKNEKKPRFKTKEKKKWKNSFVGIVSSAAF